MQMRRRSRREAEGLAMVVQLDAVPLGCEPAELLPSLPPQGLPHRCTSQSQPQNRWWAEERPLSGAGVGTGQGRGWADRGAGVSPQGSSSPSEACFRSRPWSTRHLSQGGAVLLSSCTKKPFLEMLLMLARFSGGLPGLTELNQGLDLTLQKVVLCESPWAQLKQHLCFGQ